MFRRIMAFGLFCLLVVLAVSCDDDCPTCPPPPTDPVSDYDVYLDVNDGQSPIYIYNTAQMTITDSFFLPNVDPASVVDIDVSADGRNFMATVDADESCQLRVYNLPDLEVIAAREAGRELEVSHGGRYVASFGADQLYIYLGTDYSEVFSTPIVTQSGRFSFDETKFYCVTDTFDIRVYDIATQLLDTVFRVMDEYGRTIKISTFQFNSDDSRLYLLGIGNNYDFYGRHCYAYDCMIDTLIVEDNLCSVLGDIQITSGGSLVIISDPRVGCGDFGATHIAFFDPETYAPISKIDATRCLPADQSKSFIPGRMVVTPDGMYTVAAPYAGANSLGLIDNAARSCADIEPVRVIADSAAIVACSKQLTDASSIKIKTGE